MTSLIIQDPNRLYKADAIGMALDIKNTQLYRPTGITPFEYYYACLPATFLATTMTEAPPPTVHSNAIPARPLLIANQLALRHAIRKETDEHRNHYQKEYNDTLLSGRKSSSITTSKLQGFAATGPYLIEAITSKTSVRLVDRLWGKTFDHTTPISMLTMFKARGESTLSQMEMCSLSQKPRCDAARYAAQDKRLQEFTDSLANRPD
eukprot:gene11169-13198_t